MITFAGMVLQIYEFFVNMRRVLISILAILSCLSAFAQEGKEPTPDEMAAKEADRLAELLKLEDWQVYYVDSTLQHDYAACQMELKELQTARVSNYDLYNIARDKWMEQIDNTYKRIFNDTQWAAYLKSGAAKQQKAREKRRLKIEKATEAQRKAE